VTGEKSTIIRSSFSRWHLAFGIQPFFGASIFATSAKPQKLQRKCSQHGQMLEQPAQNSILFVQTPLFNHKEHKERKD
jgi:hypothetical protein